MKEIAERKAADAARKRREYWSNPEKFLARMAAYRLKNREAMLAAVRAWRLINLDRERAMGRQRQKDNPARTRAITAKRKASKLRATPNWTDQLAVDAIYAEAVARSIAGECFEVDHVVPLQSRLVCGLHVAGNLQIIHTTLNKRKGNRVWPDMP